MRWKLAQKIILLAAWLAMRIDPEHITITVTEKDER